MNIAARSAIAALAVAGAGTAVYVAQADVERVPYAWLVAEGGVEYAVTVEGDTSSTHSTFHGAARETSRIVAERCQDGMECPEIRVEFDQGWRAETRWAEVPEEEVPEAEVLPTSVDTIYTDSTSITTAWIWWHQVDDGMGAPADYMVRYWRTADSLTWEEAPDPAAGTCMAPIRGDSVGGVISCSLGGLPPGDTYTYTVRSVRDLTVHHTPADSLSPGGQPQFWVRGDTLPVVTYWQPSPDGAWSYRVSWRGGEGEVRGSEIEMPEGWPAAYGSADSWVCVEPLDEAGAVGPEGRCNVLEEPAP